GVGHGQASWGYVFQQSFLVKADLFAWGMLVAVIAAARDQARLAAMKGGRLAIAGIVLIALGDKASQTPAMALGWALVLLWVLISFAREPRRAGPASILEAWPVALVGTVSYSVYLWHWPVILWLNRHGVTGHGWAGVVGNVALVAAVTLALSALTYRFVELPALR